MCSAPDISCFQDLVVRGIGIVTIRQLEAGVTEPRRATLVVVRQASERAGVEFIDGNGGGPEGPFAQASKVKAAQMIRSAGRTACPRHRAAAF